MVFLHVDILVKMEALVLERKMEAIMLLSLPPFWLTSS